MGIICLFGIGGNTIACTVLWQEQTPSAPTFLLQAALIADIGTVWILYIAEAIPALEYITDALSDCQMLCSYVTIITRPLLFMAQMSSAWFIILALHSRYVIMCHPHDSEFNLSLGGARKKAVLVTVVGLLLTLPLTFDAAIHVLGEPLIHNYWYRTMYLHIVLFLVSTMLPLTFAVYYCIRLALVVRSVRHLRRHIAPSFHLANMDMTQVMLAIGAVLSICYLPQMTLSISYWITQDMMFQTHCGTLQYYLSVFSNIFISINAGGKIIILCLFARRFKSQLKNQFGFKTKEASQTGVYKCSDMSEMTLLSHMDSVNNETQTVANNMGDNPVIRLLSTVSRHDNCQKRMEYQ